MNYKYKTSGTCATDIEFDLIDGKIKNVVFTRGCNGNLKAISSLVEGLSPEEIIDKCSGIKCGMKDSSCADQLSQAVAKAVEESKLD